MRVKLDAIIAILTQCYPQNKTNNDDNHDANVNRPEKSMLVIIQKYFFGHISILLMLFLRKSSTSRT